MSGRKERNGARADSQQADLRRQYRPIGIGAVVAALEATGDSAEAAKATAGRQHEREDGQAPRKSYAA
jgi:hypothetical protein